MLTLYYKPTCPFSQKLLEFTEQYDIELNLKNINSDPVILADLIDKGGKRQTPFLVDTKQGVSMYESNDIISYLQKNYVR